MIIKSLYWKDALASIIILSMVLFFCHKITTVAGDTFQIIPACYNEEHLITPQMNRFATHRLAFSRFYENWPYLIAEPLPSRQGKFNPANDAEMKEGKDSISRIVECSNTNEIKFTARSGGHNNAGASVMNGLLTIDTRGMNRVRAKPNNIGPIIKEATISPKERSYWSPGTVEVGVGATAGQALFLSFNQTSNEVGGIPYSYAGALPVGQKPSVGMAGLTLGGGFGFLTRFGGFLCDRLISFDAVIPSGSSAGEQITITKDGPYKDLFWAACGGGGGNFAVVTDFEFDLLPVCPYVPNTKEDDLTTKCNGVVQVEYYVLLSDTEAIEFYQQMSYNIDTRITANYEVFNKTHGKVAGIFLGPWSAYVYSLEAAGVTDSTPLTLSGFLQQSTNETDFAQAITDLTGWTNDDSPSTLLGSFLQERTYFKYKSFFLFEPVNSTVINMLQDLVIYDNNGDDSVVFEFQSLAGGPGTDISAYDPSNIFQSPPNNFSSVDPKATAFPHRNARHCLMLKATGNQTLEEASDLLQKMELAFFELTPYIEGRASYYNHMDVSVPGIDAYFKNGVETNPSVTEGEEDYWVERLAIVRRKYNNDGMLSNLRPCCEYPKVESLPSSYPSSMPSLPPPSGSRFGNEMNLIGYIAPLVIFFTGLLF